MLVVSYHQILLAAAAALAFVMMALLLMALLVVPVETPAEDKVVHLKPAVFALIAPALEVGVGAAVFVFSMALEVAVAVAVAVALLEIPEVREILALLQTPLLLTP